jgi:Domain of Unknown Function (DUF1080)
MPIPALLIKHSLVAATFALAAIAARAEGPEPGFKSLFNGRDLTGWRQGASALAGKTESPDHRFAAKDGILVIRGGLPNEPKATEIDTIDSFAGDFVLRFEFRAARDANSGLHLRDHDIKHQLQIRDYPRAGPYKTLKSYKSEDWNAIEVVMKDGKARCTCNGELLEEAMELPPKGPIGLQSEINALEYRNLRIKSGD